MLGLSIRWLRIAFSSPKRRVGHVAVLAATPGGIGWVVGVLRDGGEDRRVTGGAAVVAGARRFQLIVGGRVVHRVAGCAGEAAALEAGGGGEPRIFPPRHPNHAVRPETLGEKSRRRMRRSRKRVARADEVAIHRQVVAGTVPRPGLFPLGGVFEDEDRVTLAAHLRSTLRREPGRVDDRRIALAAQVLRVALDRVGVGAHVLRGRAMAPLAGDAELADAGVGAAAPGRSLFVHHAVAVGAIAVPQAGVRRHRHARRQQEHILRRDPATFIEQVVERQQIDGASGLALQPVQLLVVRPRAEHHPACPFRGAHPELVAAPPECVVGAAGCQDGAVERREDRLRRRSLCHRAVERRVPRGVLGRMTGAARLRGDEAVAADRRHRRVQACRRGAPRRESLGRVPGDSGGGKRRGGGDGHPPPGRSRPPQTDRQRPQDGDDEEDDLDDHERIEC